VREAASPRVVAQSPDYLVLYKPHDMHTAPLCAGGGGALLDWAAERFPELATMRGLKAFEGGLLHRLDFGTAGLVLAARNEASFEKLLSQQRGGLFIKEYDALASKSDRLLSGFPPDGFSLPRGALESPPFTVSSGFRAYGPGRKSVRPILHGKPAYQTEVLSLEPAAVGSGVVQFRVRLARGFRHQVRCHLSWLGFPILNDALYGGSGGDAPLALKASFLRFADPASGERREYRL
jgi:23S rRNA pseudouridine1911/1915/1917 synthase